MTRINVVPPRELTDKHLLAEYRELPRVFALASAWWRRGRDTPVPAAYTLGKGHVAFFYDKLDFCWRRHALLVYEMRQRGFKPQYETPPLVGETGVTQWINYRPTDEALRVNRERISQRLAEASLRAATRT